MSRKSYNIEIKDISENIILKYDGKFLNYVISGEDEEIEMESITTEQLFIENNGGLKLHTILDYQEELGVIADKNDIIKKIKKEIYELAQIIFDYEKIISSLNQRVLIAEREGSGHASAWMDYLYLDCRFKSIELDSSRLLFLSASEIIEYYGLEEDEYWNHIQANGEFIESQISNIKNAKELYDGIIDLLTREQWNLKKDEINWSEIISVLIQHKATNKIGIELRSIIDSYQNHIK